MEDKPASDASAGAEIADDEKSKKKEACRRP